MGEATGIEWCDKTFNPWWGCLRVSPGCEHCYAETFDKRVGGKHWGPATVDPATHKSRRFFGDKHWREPGKWNADARAGDRNARVFCASMADVFEDRADLVPHRARLFDLIEQTPCLDWQLLTKRPENMTRLAPAAWGKAWPRNVWAGASVESQEWADRRIPELLRVPARIHFVSYEPALAPVDFREVPMSDGDTLGNGLFSHKTGAGISWVIIGGESGPGARPFDLARARSTIAQCKAAGVACFVKQLGARPIIDPRYDRSLPGATRQLRDRKGGDMAEWPEDLRVREFPR